MDILLTLGDVPLQHYAPVVDAMLDRGMHPQIVRVSTKLPDESAFFEFLYSIDESYGFSEEEYGKVIDSRTEALKKEIIRESFGLLPLDDVQAIIFEPIGEDDSSETRMTWLTGMVTTDYAEYTVNIGDDGSPWLQGEGLGDLEIQQTT